MVFDGSGRVEDELAGSAADFGVQLTDFPVGFRRTQQRDRVIDIDGHVRGGCFAEPPRLSTLESLVFGTESRCPRSGVLEVQRGRARVQVRFEGDEPVHIDIDGDGVADQEFGSCQVMPRVCGSSLLDRRS